MKKKTKRIIFTSIIVVILLAFLVISTFSGGSLASKTVSELKKEKNMAGKPLQLTGKVVKGTFEAHDKSYTFSITDGKEKVKIAYSGILPNSFKDDAQVIAEGKLGQDGVFAAKTLMVKCPSKYVPSKEAEKPDTK